MNTITNGGEQVPRTVAGALGRLELAVSAQDARADVDFLRDHINKVEAERDELRYKLQSLGTRPYPEGK